VGNGAGLHIAHVGHSSIITSADKTLALRNVLHVPHITKNLISIYRLTKDNHVYVEFLPDFFVIKDLATRRTLLRGACRGGLYPLPPSIIHHVRAAMLASVNKRQWHHRLGHPSSQVVQSILSLNKLPVSGTHDTSICNACQMAKSHQLPYGPSSFVAQFPLELIYSDVWGPTTVSVGGYKYYVSFIDAFSKFTWIYLLHAKSDVEQVFIRFQTHVERLLNRKILCIQSDWGGEYQRLHKYFQTHGIAHHVSCPYTHQQNGAAERKHRHIVETGLALLAHSCMPVRFWDEAFLTATFLINRLPTRVIDNASPMERLFKSKPDYTMLKSFGCACWPHLRPLNNKKLAFPSKECVFVGYGSHHKGYKCLDTTTGHIYISRDVVFDESVFPFSRTTQVSLAPTDASRPSYAQLLSPPAAPHPPPSRSINGPVDLTADEHAILFDPTAGTATESESSAPTSPCMGHASGSDPKPTASPAPGSPGSPNQASRAASPPP
jgi:histone deacetylase 1/2